MKTFSGDLNESDSPFGIDFVFFLPDNSTLSLSTSCNCPKKLFLFVWARDEKPPRKKLTTTLVKGERKFRCRVNETKANN